MTTRAPAAPRAVPHPDGGVVTWDEMVGGWVWQRADGTIEVVPLDDAQALCDTVEQRNALAAWHSWRMLDAHDRAVAGDADADGLFRALHRQFEDASQFYTSAMIAADLGVRAKTVAGYVDDPRRGMPRPAWRVGRRHGRVLLWTRRQVESWDRPGQGWRAPELDGA